MCKAAKNHQKGPREYLDSVTFHFAGVVCIHVLVDYPFLIAKIMVFTPWRKGATMALLLPTTIPYTFIPYTFIPYALYPTLLASCHAENKVQPE